MEQSLWKIEWDEGMAFHIPALDDEHRELIRSINSLNEAISGNSRADELEDYLLRVREEAMTHFGHEEAVLAQSNYPWLKGHILLHERLKAELENVAQTCRNLKDHDLWVEYGLLIRQIFVDHFLDETKKYRDFQSS